MTHAILATTQHHTVDSISERSTRNGNWWNIYGNGCLSICVVCERWVYLFICTVCITIGIIKLIVIRVSMREMCINANTTQPVSEVINKISGSAVLSCWFGPHKRIHLWNSRQKNKTDKSSSIFERLHISVWNKYRWQLNENNPENRIEASMRGMSSNGTAIVLSTIFRRDTRKKNAVDRWKITAKIAGHKWRCWHWKHSLHNSPFYLYFCFRVLWFKSAFVVTFCDFTKNMSRVSTIYMKTKNISSAERCESTIFVSIGLPRVGISSPIRIIVSLVSFFSLRIFRSVSTIRKRTERYVLSFNTEIKRKNSQKSRFAW